MPKMYPPWPPIDIQKFVCSSNHRTGKNVDLEHHVHLTAVLKLTYPVTMLLPGCMHGHYDISSALLNQIINKKQTILPIYLYLLLNKFMFFFCTTKCLGYQQVKNLYCSTFDFSSYALLISKEESTDLLFQITVLL